MAALDSHRRADAKRAAGTAGRFGLATRGALYGLVGVLAIDVAHGGHRRHADPPGALRAVADGPLGRWVVTALTVGFALLAGWHAIRVWRGRTAESDRHRVNRLLEAGRAVVAAALCVVAGRVLLSPESESSQRQRQQEGAFTVFDWPGGRWLVGTAGLAAIVFGLWQLRKASTPADSEPRRVSTTARRVSGAVRAAGYVGRGLAFALVGWFLTHAAATYDPQEATGLDVALSELEQTAYGSWLTTIVGAGLLAFGGHLVMAAVYAPQGEL